VMAGPVTCMIQAALFLIGRCELRRAFGHRCLSIIGPTEQSRPGPILSALG
jgi:hypothetical protein